MSSIHWTLESNLKNAPSILAGTSNRIFIVGPNGSGKSAIVHSIELALFKGVREAAGRNVRKSSYIDLLSREDRAKAEFTQFQGGPLPDRDIVSETLDVLSGPGHGLIAYLLKHHARLGEGEPPSLPQESWPKWVELKGGPVAALGAIRESTARAVRAQRATCKELKVAVKYSDDLGVLDMAAAEEANLLEVLALQKTVEDAANAWVRSLAPWFEQTTALRLVLPKSGEIRMRPVGGGDVPSGVELILTALSLAWRVTTPEERAKCVAILPDRAYDPATLTQLLVLLQAQGWGLTVVQSVVHPREEALTGWNVVETGPRRTSAVLWADSEVPTPQEES